ncbi:MAG: TlpA disulfide reductase family protein [Rubrivivax sp.]
MSRSAQRRWLLLGAGAVAAAAGAGLSWWRTGTAGDGAANSASSSSKVDSEGLWARRFPQPDGGELVMAEHRGRPLVVNFWATWCAPCIKELPELNRFHRDQDGKTQVIGLAVDRLAPVQEFLAKMPLEFPVGMAGMAGVELARELGNSAGVLPFTVVFDRTGQVVHQRLGETSYDELTAWVAAL